MNGSDLGRAVAGQIMMLVIIAFAVGGTFALMAYFAIGWVLNNVSITIG